MAFASEMEFTVIEETKDGYQEYNDDVRRDRKPTEIYDMD